MADAAKGSSTLWKVISVIVAVAAFLVGRIELAGEYKGIVNTHDRDLYGAPGKEGLIDKVENLRIQQGKTEAHYEEIMKALTELKKTMEGTERHSRRANGSD